MGKFARAAEKRAKLANGAQKEPSAKKKKVVVDNLSRIATMDNGTMVEVFKFLNYYQLANNNLVSKRFRNLIQAHRNSLALLYVKQISMDTLSCQDTVSRDFFTHNAVKRIKNELSSKAYNRWVIRNGYSKQIPIEGQVVGNESTLYELCAIAYIGDSLEQNSCHQATVFCALAELHHDNWPLFQHFVCLLTDPFIYIEHVKFTTQNDVLSLMTRTINSNHGRIHCDKLDIIMEGSAQKFIGLIKNYFRCNKINICNFDDLNSIHKGLRDLFVTGAHCTSKINVVWYDLSKIVVDFVQVNNLAKVIND